MSIKAIGLKGKETNKKTQRPSTEPEQNTHEHPGHRFLGFPLGAASLSSLRPLWPQVLVTVTSHQESHRLFLNEAGLLSQERETPVPVRRTDLRPESRHVLI